MSFRQEISQRLKQKIRKRRSGAGKARPFANRILNGDRLVAVDIGAAHGLEPHWRVLEDTCFCQLHSQIERGLASNRGQHGLWTFTANDFGRVRKT